MPALAHLVIILVLLGGGLYVVQLLIRKAPIDDTVKQVILVVLWVAAIICLIDLLLPFLHWHAFR